MKTLPVLCLVYTILLEISTIVVATNTPTLSQDVAVPVTTNTVYLQKPFCYFNSAQCSISPCTIWLVAAQDSAMSTFDSSKNDPNFLNLSPYPTAFNDGQKKYFMTSVGPQSAYDCTASATSPSYFLVGADGSCSGNNCNGVLPVGSTMRFKYFLLGANSKLVAETDWSDGITLKTVKDPGSLGSGYAGRSAAMVVITSILCIAAALLLLLLLIALILACCYKSGKTQSYQTRRDPSVLGSLRIPSYDVHHLKNPSPYENPAYEQDLSKKRYTINSTLPQKTTTVINTVQNNPPDNITLQKM